MTHVYIAGPMTGYPQFNFPAFREAATILRSLGYQVTSPAEEDSVEVQHESEKSTTGQLDAAGKIGGQTWGDLLARDVKLIADGGIDALALLPGWENSRGARLEVFVAMLCGRELRSFDRAYPDDLEWMSYETAIDFLGHSFLGGNNDVF